MAILAKAVTDASKIQQAQILPQLPILSMCRMIPIVDGFTDYGPIFTGGTSTIDLIGDFVYGQVYWIKAKEINYPERWMVKNIKINDDGIEIITNFAAQYKEELIDNNVYFNAYIVKIGELDNYFGHIEYDANGALYHDNRNNVPELDQKADFYLDSNIRFVNGSIKL